MRRTVVLSVVGVAVIGLAWLFSRSSVSYPLPSSEISKSSVSQVSPVPPSEPRQASPMQNPVTLGATSNNTASKSAPVQLKTLQTALKPGETVRHAFRMVLNQGQCALEAVEEVHGNFRPARKPMWAPGMLCCRLLNLQNEVIAEETMFSPDHNCAVLDPNVRDLNGNALPSHLTPAGPIAFQARFPNIQGAVLLNIYRVSTATPPAENAEPEGQLLGSIPLSL